MCAQLADFCFSLWLQQPVAGASNHHRVKHQSSFVSAAQPFRNCIDGVAITKHADLDGIDFDVVRNASELFAQKFLWRGMDTAYTLCVLRYQGGDYGHAETAGSSNRFQISLSTSTACGISASNG